MCYYLCVQCKYTNILNVGIYKLRLFIRGYRSNNSLYCETKIKNYIKYTNYKMYSSHPLTYKFPQLFIDIINVFQNESTDEKMTMTRKNITYFCKRQIVHLNMIRKYNL